MDLSNNIVLDITTGTYFNAAHAVLIDNDSMSPDDSDLLDSGASDAEVAEIGERGLTEGFARDLEHLARDAAALDAIAALLNAEQWSSDHLSVVAELICATGRTIADI